MRIAGLHKDPKGKSKKSPAQKKRKAFSKLKKDLFKQVKKICRDRMPCIMMNQGFGSCGGVVCASHIKSVGAWPNLSHDPNNIFPMCSRHHLLVWHKDVTETGKWFNATYPDIIEYLESAKQNHPNFNDPNFINSLFEAANAGYEAYCIEYEALV